MWRGLKPAPLIYIGCVCGTRERVPFRSCPAWIVRQGKADSSAALRNDKQKCCGMTNQETGATVIAAGCRFRVGIWGLRGDDDGGGYFVAGVEVRRGRDDQVGELAFSSRSMSSMVTPASHWWRSAV